MIIKPVKFYEKGFTAQPAAFGGEEGADKFDPSVRYRACLTNYVVDTGDEVILIDTGLPKEFPGMAYDENVSFYLGTPITDYLSALKALGYGPENVSKILLTHKHDDHSGELRSFPNAKIYMSPEEADALKLDGENIVRVEYKDGPYYEFPASEKIADGVYFIPAKGHTSGSSLVIVESDGLFYMIHGDLSYTDEAMYADKLSIVFDDLALARETQNRARAFIRNHPTVYVSTHTPLGYENLEAKRVMDLDNPPEVIPIDYEFVKKEESGKYVCSVCGCVYDPEIGDPEHGIPAGTPFENLPDDWKCPRCRQAKDKFGKA